LEAYVLGALSDEENEQVTKMVAAYPELKKELDAIEEAMYQHALSNSKTPPASLRGRIINSIPEAEETKVVSLSIKKKSGLYYLAAASVIVALFSASFAAYFWSKWQQAEQKVLAMEQQNTAIAQNLNLVNNKLKQDITIKEQSIANLQKDLSLVLDTTTTIIKLNGLTISPTASAVVLWNKATHDVFIDVKSLPTPPSDKQYQLWALQNGKPVDAGVFDVLDTSYLQKVKNIESAQAFAVTLEKKGGSPTPTFDAMYLMGKL